VDPTFLHARHCRIMLGDWNRVTNQLLQYSWCSIDTDINCTVLTNNTSRVLVHFYCYLFVRMIMVCYAMYSIEFVLLE
jgi:hypothetical protein